MANITEVDYKLEFPYISIITAYIINVLNIKTLKNSKRKIWFCSTIKHVKRFYNHDANNRHRSTMPMCPHARSHKAVKISMATTMETLEPLGARGFRDRTVSK